MSTGPLWHLKLNLCYAAIAVSEHSWQRLKVKGKLVCRSLQLASPLWELTCHVITPCHPLPGGGDIPTSILAEAGTRFSNPRQMQG